MFRCCRMCDVYTTKINKSIFKFPDIINPVLKKMGLFLILNGVLPLLKVSFVFTHII